MKIIEKISAKAKNNRDFGTVTIAFLGDSVTQGCFEIYKRADGGIETVYDSKNNYGARLSVMLGLLFPSVPINMICAGRSGDTAPRGSLRVSRDVIRHAPDLAIVCYGLNDCSRGENSEKRYTQALASIFDQLLEREIEVIFMTPNMMNTALDPRLSDRDFLAIAENCAFMQNEGVFDRHIEAARALCREKGIPVCDCYALWKQMEKSGVDTTALLSNHINHPLREMHFLFSYELLRTIFLET
jgi:lysophospholipase L1-like esterase